ncbi:hypothetical protein [Acerihabitans arboris]|uniref:Uncharacterized protein n=1 Tax=Acerihabitans arboris TaxID=2691583 RepID=A0A845SJM4_9GAMM|nr:hypothetical protein [Acerihabitans arboris]NDL65423.1 hypothetical protein [Acerihabitans arboris]
MPQLYFNVITLDSINRVGGVQIQIRNYYPAAAGDHIWVYWNGEVVYEDFLNDPFTDLPLNFLLPAERVSLGAFSVYYVLRTLTGNQNSSEVLFGTISVEAPPPGVSLNMILTTGAAYTDFSQLQVNPLNRGVIYGPPNRVLSVNVQYPGVIVESGAQNASLTLNQNGEGNFGLYSLEPGPVSVLALTTSVPSYNVGGTTLFESYRPGNGAFSLINATTGAPANGRTVNSIYLQTARLSPITGNPITYVQIWSPSNTVRRPGVPGGTSNATLNSDNSVTIDLFNSVAESADIYLSLPEDGGAQERVILDFVPNPSANFFSGGYLPWLG